MKIGSREYKEWLDSPLTKALKSSFEQSVTDPENQPSQYGTVTLAMHELVCKQRDLAVEALEDQLAAAQEEVEASSKDSLRLLESVKYLRGIAEHGEERQQREDETVEQFVLGYVKKLEDQLAKANQLWQIAQGRCDGLEEKLAKAEQRVTSDEMTTQDRINISPDTGDVSIGTPGFSGDTSLGFDKPSAFSGSVGSCMYIRDPENVSSMYLTVDQNQQFRFRADGKPVSKFRKFLLHPVVAMAVGYLLGLVTAWGVK